MTFDDFIEKIKEHWLMTIIIVVGTIFAVYYVANESSKTGLQNYDYYIVGWKFEVVKNTGVGQQFYYQININDRFVSSDEPVIPGKRNLSGYVKIIEDDKYDDTAIHYFSLDSYKENSIVFYMTIKENGGITNAGSYAEFKVTLSFIGDPTMQVDYDYPLSFKNSYSYLLGENSFICKSENKKKNIYY